MGTDADVIIVGAGLAGLVAAAELADANKRVRLVDQEGPQNMGGQAWWSFGGLFFVDSPEQRRLRVRDSYELALANWLGTAGFDRPEVIGRAAGPKRTLLLPPAKSAPGYTRWACASFRSWAGPSVAVRRRLGMATRCRAFM